MFDKSNRVSEGIDIVDDGKRLDRMRKAAELRTLSEAQKTSDKLTFRSQYNDALTLKGVSMTWIVEQLKSIAEDAEPKTALQAVKTLLQSVGMDKYEESESAAKSWEETLSKAVDHERAGLLDSYDVPDYEVIEPKVPELMEGLSEAADKLAKSL